MGVIHQKFNQSQLSISIPAEIKELLKTKVINPNCRIDVIYQAFDAYFKEQYDLPVERLEEFDYQLSKFDFAADFSFLKDLSVRTIGIDFPIKLSKGKNRPVLMICAIHREILETEINCINPTAILTLGNGARDAICELYKIYPPTWTNEIFKTNLENGCSLVMVPHISGAANGSKAPILNNVSYNDIPENNNTKYANIILKELLIK